MATGATYVVLNAPSLAVLTQFQQSPIYISKAHRDNNLSYTGAHPHMMEGFPNAALFDTIVPNP